MYQFTQLITFPHLDETYLKQLDVGAMERVFDHIGFRPALMKDIVKAMSAEGIVDMALGLRRFAESGPMVAAWEALLGKRDRIEQLTLIALANSLLPTSKETIDTLARIGPSGITLSKVRTALTRLNKERILAKNGSAYQIDEPLFADYLLRLAPLQIN